MPTCMKCGNLNHNAKKKKKVTEQYSQYKSSKLRGKIAVISQWLRKNWFQVLQLVHWNKQITVENTEFQGWFIHHYLYAWAGVLTATSAASFTTHRCNAPFRSPAKAAVFEQLQPASKQLLILLLFPRHCSQNCCKLVPLSLQVN